MIRSDRPVEEVSRQQGKTMGGENWERERRTRRTEMGRRSTVSLSASCRVFGAVGTVSCCSRRVAGARLCRGIQSRRFGVKWKACRKFGLSAKTVSKPRQPDTTPHTLGDAPLTSRRRP